MRPRHEIQFAPPARRSTPRRVVLGWAPLTALVVAALLLAGSARANSLEKTLAEAGQAYRDGNYRVAAVRLNALVDSESQLSRQQQLAVWDLCANVAEASGMLPVAQRAGVKHLALLERMPAQATDEPGALRRRALVRLARIKRSTSGAESGVPAGDAPSKAALQSACALYREALGIRQHDEASEPLWEAETRWELARTLALLEQPDEASTEYAAASRSAEAAIEKLPATQESADYFLRGATIIRQAHLKTDEPGAEHQAERGLQHLRGRLQAGDASPDQRGKMIMAVAACYRQLDNSAREQAVLERLLREADREEEVTSIEPLERGEALIRLAELAESADAQPPEIARPRSDAYYGEAARLYSQQYAEAKEDRLRNEKPASDAPADSQAPDAPTSIGKESECLSQLQLIYTRLEEWEKAIEGAEELLKLRRGSLLTGVDPLYFRTLSSLGSLYAKKARAARMPEIGVDRDFVGARDDVRSAQRHLHDALNFWRQYRPQSPVDLAITLNHYAEVLRYNGDFREADELLNELIGVVNAHRGSVFGDGDLLLGEFYVNRAAVQAALGQFVLALPYYERAADIAKFDSKAGVQRERPRLLAMIYLNMAQLHKSQRHIAEARWACEQAFEASKEAGLAPHERVAFELANASLLIAEAEQDYALLMNPRASSELSPPRSSDDVRDKLSEAIKTTTEILRPQAAVLDFNTATAAHLQALARFRLHEMSGAGEDELQRAEQLWNRIAESGSQESRELGILQIRALSYLVAIALRDVAEARRQAHAQSQADDSDDERIASLVADSERRLDEAIVWSQRGEEAASRMVAYPAVRVQALLARAHVLRAQAQIHSKRANASLAADRTNDAIDRLQQALEIIELPRAMTVGAEEERAEYLAQFAPLFDLLVDMLVENKRYVEALDVAEKRRSRTFQDQLRTSGVDISATAPSHLVVAARKAQDAYFSKLAQLNEQGSHDTLRDKLLKELVPLRADFVAAERNVKSQSIAARQLLIEDPLSAASASEPVLDDDRWIARHLGGEDAVALLYYIGAEKSYVFACGQKLGIVCQKLTVSADQARERGLPHPPRDGKTDARPLRAADAIKLVSDVRHGTVEDYRSSLRRAAGTSASDSEGLRIVRSAKVDSESDYIATDILLPRHVRKQLVDSGAEYLIIVPDGALHQIPFELLPVVDSGSSANAEPTRYLLDDLPPICYAPSLHIYRTLRDEPASAEWELALLSVADPSYPASTQAGDQVDLEAMSSVEVGREFLHYWRRGGLVDLPETKAESNAVRDAVRNAIRDPKSSHDNIEQLLGAKATEAELKDMIEQRKPIRLLHIAAHGLVSQQYNNLFGALALTPPDSPTAHDDGFLSLHEVFSLPLKGCELAVLSACETNCGADSPLEAGSTLARAFICAGAKRVVSSHWSVDDAATTELIAEFMRRVGDDLSAQRPVDFAKALREAKRRMRNHPDHPEWAAPYYWAPFVLIGPSNTESDRDRRRTVAVRRD